MTRIPYVDWNEMEPRLASLFADRPRLNLYRALANSPATAEAFVNLGAAMRSGSLDPKLRELVILRVGALSSAGYEVHQHRQVARREGLSEEKVAAAVMEGPVDVLDAHETQVMALVDAVVASVKAPAHLYEAVAARSSSQQMIDLLMLIGFYMMVCRFLENAEIDIEPTQLVLPS